MAYLTSPTTADLQGMETLKRAELAASWQTISQHLKQHREHLKLSGWELYALKRVGELAGQQAHEELSTMIRDFFTIAGSNIGLEQNDYKRNGRRKNGRN